MPYLLRTLFKHALTTILHLHTPFPGPIRRPNKLLKRTPTNPYFLAASTASPPTTTISNISSSRSLHLVFPEPRNLGHRGFYKAVELQRGDPCVRAVPNGEMYLRPGSG